MRHRSLADGLALEECWKDKTAWAAGDRYGNPGNWATYTAMNAESFTFASVGDGTVDITIVLNPGWRFAEVDENLKIQGYEFEPSGNPNPGGFDPKFTVVSPAKVNVPAANFYGVHADVERPVECPDEE